MKLLLISGISAVLLYLIWSSRRRSIVGIASRNRHFKTLASKLRFHYTDDGYFCLLDGVWKSNRVLIYPHNFEGPGSITLFYADIGVPIKERTWAEPNLSLGRALVQWKSGTPYDFEFTGDFANAGDPLRKLLERYTANYSYVAITLPTRHHFSPLIQDTLQSWQSFVVMLALDSGRKPSQEQMQRALDACAEIIAAFRAVRT